MDKIFLNLKKSKFFKGEHTTAIFYGFFKDAFLKKCRKVFNSQCMKKKYFMHIKPGSAGSTL